jgi:peptide/nickel transport system substrate-binding protein
MRSSLTARSVRLLVAAGMAFAVLLPGGASVSAADDKILRLGTLQKIDSLNPYVTALTTGYEAFELTYDQMVGFGPNLEPIPAFATSWERNADGKSWTFKFRPDLKWSDGQPATSADACFSWQLDIDAIAKGESVGVGYLDPGLKDAGVTKVECPDATTMIAYTDDASDRILQTYIPILPQHIWGKMNYKQIGDAKFDPPADGSGAVGTGPYLLTEFKTGEYARLKQNPSYWGTKAAPEEIIIQFFGTNDTMVQALKAGEIDYARRISKDLFNQLKTVPNVKTVNGATNGWTELGFNTYGTGTGKTIKGGGPSTKALQDPVFRDALGYAIDKQKLIDNVLGGYGTIGSTQVPPVIKDWHVDPKNPRTFDIELAKQKLTAAGYVLDGSGARLDKEGKPISLRLVMPDDNPAFPKAGQFIQDWFSQLGIKVSPKVYDSGALVDVMLPPEAGGASNKADYDMFIWDWSWGPNINDALQVFECEAIGYSSDSLWCNHDYDQLFKAQHDAATPEERHALLDQMQNMFYDQAPYHILYYDDELDAYRTDKWGGWQNQPPNGTPLFAYSILGETLLTDASAAPSPTVAPSAGTAASSGPTSVSPAPSSGTGGSGSTTSSAPIIPIIAIVVVVAVVALFLIRRRSSPKVDDEDDE